MKARLAWLADPEDADSYSAREARVLLRAIAREGETVPIWFAVGAREAPHCWNSVRVFPVPPDPDLFPTFLGTLLHQQRPTILLSNLPLSRFHHTRRIALPPGCRWIHRLNPEDFFSEAGTDKVWSGATITPSIQVAGYDNKPQDEERTLPLSSADNRSPSSIILPYLAGMHPLIPNGADPSIVLEELRRVIAGQTEIHNSRPPATYLVMRQQVFCNVSLAHVMFELTNALLELSVPSVAQEEHTLLSKEFVQKEEELFRTGAPEKYRRVVASLNQEYDPEKAITVHFSMLRANTGYSREGVFRGLGKREVCYVTGNHTVSKEDVRSLSSQFEMILAPSQHTLQPYFEAGLSPLQGARVPHGVDPVDFSAESPPYGYPTKKGFKFIQTSFPWIYEKGFDLTLKAFGRAFSSHDDVALVFRIPRILNGDERKRQVGRLQDLIKDESTTPGAPEFLLVEKDVEINRRGGVYTGADCYVHPLRAEGFGMTILEAMACGLPVIATAWSGPADFLSPHCAYTLRHSKPIAERRSSGSIRGYHVEPDLDHLIHLMRYVYANQDEAHETGKRAASFARNQWTWRHAALKLASLFSLI